MPKNATIQIKPLTPRQANFRVNENMRLGTNLPIQILSCLKDNRASTSFSTEKKNEAKMMLMLLKKLMHYEHQSAPTKNAF